MIAVDRDDLAHLCLLMVFAVRESDDSEMVAATLRLAERYMSHLTRGELCELLDECRSPSKSRSKLPDLWSDFAAGIENRVASTATKPQLRLVPNA